MARSTKFRLQRSIPSAPLTTNLRNIEMAIEEITAGINSFLDENGEKREHPRADEDNLRRLYLNEQVVAGVVACIRLRSWLTTFAQTVLPPGELELIEACQPLWEAEVYPDSVEGQRLLAVAELDRSRELAQKAREDGDSDAAANRDADVELIERYIAVKFPTPQQEVF